MEGETIPTHPSLLSAAGTGAGLGPPGPQQQLQQPQLNYRGARRRLCPVDRHPDERQPPERLDTSQRLRALRTEMRRISTLQTDPVDAYVVTSDDEHQSESVASRDARLEFISGFSGSAGDALVTATKALLWTDGRYFIQADGQLDCNWILMKYPKDNVPSIVEWLKHEFQDKSNSRIGADPKLISAATWQGWEDDLANTTIRLIAVENNLVDTIWQLNRPEYNRYEAYPLNLTYSGQPWQEKIKKIRDEMSYLKVSALVVTALDEIAWLLNIRGYDLPHTPVLRAYAIVELGRIRLYAERHKLHKDAQVHLKMDECYHADCVTLIDYSKIFDDLRTLHQIWSLVWLPGKCGYSLGASQLVYSCIPAGKRLVRPSPIIELRAEKNEVEAEGMRRAHVRDAVALCDFFAYMDEQLRLGSAGWDELQVARIANEFRFEQDDSMGISFPTIVGYGPHAALPHYEPSNLTNALLGNDSVLVIDSGGQYKDGTTDVTRTLHFGEPTTEQRVAYTQVLIGHIEFASAVFPQELKSSQLDVFARMPLWRRGYDYLHGTGHGIGHFSSVHESPIGVYYRSGTGIPEEGCDVTELKPGYFLSNEPGFYMEGEFGIRLENIVEVVRVNAARMWGRRFLKFQDVTLVPYEPKLYELEMLTPNHRRWLNNYNQRVRDEVGRELKRHLRMKGFRWMMSKTDYIPEWDNLDRDKFLRKTKIISDNNDNSANEFNASFALTLILLLIIWTRLCDL